MRAVLEFMFVDNLQLDQTQTGTTLQKLRGRYKIELADVSPLDTRRSGTWASARASGTWLPVSGAGGTSGRSSLGRAAKSLQTPDRRASRPVSSSEGWTRSYSTVRGMESMHPMVLRVPSRR